MTTTSELFAIAEAAIDYEVARLVALKLERQRNAISCDGTEPRWLSSEQRADVSMRCASCRRRKQLHEAYTNAAKTRGLKLRALRRITAKAIDPKTIDRRVAASLPAVDQPEPVTV